MKPPAYRSPGDVANELTEQHIRAVGCEDCTVEGEDGYDLCSYHEGYREGTLVLLLKASVR